MASGSRLTELTWAVVESCVDVIGVPYGFLNTVMESNSHVTIVQLACRCNRRRKGSTLGPTGGERLGDCKGSLQL